MSFAIDKTIAANEQRFHYRDWGGQGMPLLLLHDLGSTSHVWDLAAPLLLDDYRVIALDLRGHGQSDKPDEGYGFKPVARDIRHVLAGLDIEEPVLAGHGWGARIALHIAARKPDSLRGVVLLNGGLIDARKIPVADVEAAFGMPDVTSAQAYRDRIVEETPQGLVTPAVEAALLAMYEIDPDDRLRPRAPRAARREIIAAIRAQPLPDLYRKVRRPVLVLPVRGTPDEGRRKRSVETLAEVLEDVEVAWLEPCQFDAPLQRPHALAEHMRRFARERV